MIKNKQLTPKSILILRLQNMTTSYYENKGYNTKLQQMKSEARMAACKTLIWMVIEHQYSKRTAAKLVAKNSNLVCWTAILKDLKKILPNRISNLTTKVHQHHFFSALERVS
jgi:predicted nuclease of predicted toxin-antitoxin system